MSGLQPRQAGLIDLSRWPPEPALRQCAEPLLLARALDAVCRGIPAETLQDYAGWIVEYGERFGVDPLLLAAVVYRQSRCRPDQESDWGLGLAAVNPRMHGEHLRDGVYTYWVLSAGGWERRTLDVSAFRFTRGNLLRPRPNLYFAAALLHIHAEQCPANDGVFGSVPHRHSVSHFAWGDRVRGADAEDRILQTRRRLVAHYLEHDQATEPLARYEGLPLLCPLEGAPRKVTGVLGEDRAGGRRPHMGIDFASSRGEPVHAIAAGRVVLAGLDRKRGSSVNLRPDVAAKVPASRMGPGGLWVMIEHENGLRSAYMHLSGYRVRIGRSVAAGEVIGWVGRTGIRTSSAHLHFELRKDGRHLDPLPVLAPYLIEPDATWRGRRVAREQRRVQRRRRIEARRAARRAREAARGSDGQTPGRATAPAPR